MKKFLCSFLGFLLLCSCTNKNSKDVETEPLLISGFSCVIRTTLNDIEITADAEYLASGTILLEFTDPETVKGMQINCTGGEYTVHYKNLELTVSGDKMPFNMVCRGLEECINNAQGTTPVKDENGESLVYTYTAEGHACKLFVNPETKYFEKITVDGIDTLFFENFTYVYGTD